MNDPHRLAEQTLASGGSSETIVELLEEEIAVARRTVRGQTVRIATTTRSRDEAVEVPLVRDRVDVERVAVGRVVDTTPAVREEGDFTVYPVMEESSSSNGASS